LHCLFIYLFNIAIVLKVQKKKQKCNQIVKKTQVEVFNTLFSVYLNDIISTFLLLEVNVFAQHYLHDP